MTCNSNNSGGNACTSYLSQKVISDVKSYVMSMLGHPNVVVELEDGQFEEIMESAVNFLAGYVGKSRYCYSMVQARRSQYTLPADCHTVERVFYDPTYLSVLGNLSTAIFSDFYLLASDLAVDIYESPVTFWSYLASREMLTKVYGVWTDFEVVEGNQLFKIDFAPQ